VVCNRVLRSFKVIQGHRNHCRNRGTVVNERSNLADKRPCSRVNWHVSRKVVVRVELFPADWARNLFDRLFHVLVDDIFQAVLQVYDGQPHLGIWLFLLRVVVVARGHFRGRSITR